MVAEYLLLNCSWRVGEDLIHSQLIYSHSHCLEPVVPIKKQGERKGKAGQKVGGLDHSATGTPPIKGGIILEQGHLIADGLPSTVKAWQVASSHRSAMSTGREIITKISGKVVEKGRDNCQDVCSILIHKKGFLISSLEILRSLSLEKEWILVNFKKSF